MTIVPFQFAGHNIRAFTLGGKPYFVARDIAAVLAYANPQKAIRDHCKNAQAIGVNESFTLDPQTLIIPEGDVYRLIMRSKMPEAQKFETLVMDEILPAIRATGSYGTPKAEAPVLPADPLLASLEVVRQLRMEQLQISQQVQAITQRLDESPITSEKVGTIYKLGQELGRCMGNYAQAWRIFKNQFNLASYRDLPSHRFEEAVRFLRVQIAAYTGQPLLEVQP